MDIFWLSEFALAKSQEGKRTSRDVVLDLSCISSATERGILFVALGYLPDIHAVVAFYDSGNPSDKFFYYL
jgi:hypothetical protein